MRWVVTKTNGVDMVVLGGGAATRVCTLCRVFVNVTSVLLVALSTPATVSRWSPSRPAAPSAAPPACARGSVGNRRFSTPPTVLAAIPFPQLTMDDIARQASFPVRAVLLLRLQRTGPHRPPPTHLRGDGHDDGSDHRRGGAGHRSDGGVHRAGVRQLALPPPRLVYLPRDRRRLPRIRAGVAPTPRAARRRALTSIIQREHAAGRAAPSPPPARAIASSWFWMLENQFYTLFLGAITPRARGA